MKKLAILGIIFLGFNSFGQNVIVENIDHNKVLYRGFQNNLIIGQINNSNGTFQMEAINCEVSKLNENNNTYSVKTKSKARTAQINFISDGQTIDSVSFIVQNLPSPSLFWGNHKTGSDFSNSSLLEVKYPFGIRLKSSFEIVEWNCILNNVRHEGIGNILSQEVLKLTNSMAIGDLVKIEVKVKGTDGIIRKTAGSWNKQ